MKKFIYALALSVFTLSAAAGCSAQTAQENTQDTSQETVVEELLRELLRKPMKKRRKAAPHRPWIPLTKISP